MTEPGASAEYEVTALRYGTRTARRSEVFLHFELYGEPDRELAMDYFVWVARNADRTVLIDCGFNEHSGARRNRTMLIPPVEALRQIGVDAAEVSQLIVTHAHYDGPAGGDRRHRTRRDRDRLGRAALLLSLIHISEPTRPY